MHAVGVGHSKDSEARETRYENAKKRSVSNAHRNAFTNIAVIRLANGKMDLRDLNFELARRPEIRLAAA